MEKAKEFQKGIYFCFIDYAKAFDCVDHNKLKNSDRDVSYWQKDKSCFVPVDCEIPAGNQGGWRLGS